MSEQLTIQTVDPLADVVAWTRQNPSAWQFVVELAFRDRRNGIPPSTRYYCCILRRPEHARRLGLSRCSSALLVNDHLSSGMARLLNRLYPELECPTRKAWADEVGEGGGMILFKPEHVELIVSGRKTQTRRLGKKRWNVGAVHACYTRPPFAKGGAEPFCRVRIMDVHPERLVDISPEDVLSEGYDTKQDFLRAFFTINPKASGGLLVWVVTFEVAP